MLKHLSINKSPNVEVEQTDYAEGSVPPEVWSYSKEYAELMMKVYERKAKVQSRITFRVKTPVQGLVVGEECDISLRVRYDGFNWVERTARLKLTNQSVERRPRYDLFDYTFEAFGSLADLR